MEMAIGIIALIYMLIKGLIGVAIIGAICYVVDLVLKSLENAAGEYK